MSIGELKDLIADLDNNMQVVIDLGEGVIGNACIENSRVQEMELYFDENEYQDDTFINDFISEIQDDDISEDDGYDDESIEVVSVLVLVPCTGHHHEEPEIGEINSQPELN